MNKFKLLSIRILLLIIAGLGGIALLHFFNHCLLDGIICWLGINEYSRFISSLQLLLLGLPTFALLWYFRTNDTREQVDKSTEQIDKSTEQINQGQLFEGLKNLTDDDALKIEVGTQQLIILSKSVPSYDEQIKLAFIERLKRPPKLERDNEDKEIQPKQRYTYAQYILDWLAEYQNEHGGEMNLEGCDFSFQEFSKKTNFDVLRKDSGNKIESLSFYMANLIRANLIRANLIRANLIRANLSDANLSDADLSDADLSDADLNDANLSNTDLRGANLNDADFTYADLRGAKLSLANLSGANLCLANLSGANLSDIDVGHVDLSNTNFHGAYWLKDDPPPNFPSIVWENYKIVEIEKEIDGVEQKCKMLQRKRN